MQIIHFEMLPNPADECEEEDTQLDSTAENIMGWLRWTKH